MYYLFFYLILFIIPEAGSADVVAWWVVGPDDAISCHVDDCDQKKASVRGSEPGPTRSIFRPSDRSAPAARAFPLGSEISRRPASLAWDSVPELVM